jgi:heat shock protein HslJ
VLSSGLDVEGWEQTAPSVTFADGTVGGSTGCNRFTASYTLDGDAVELGMVASTQIACPPPADAVERAYLDAIGRVAGWELDGEDSSSATRRATSCCATPPRRRSGSGR